jgi:hypothetical protein
MGISYPTLALLSLQLAEPGRQGQASSALQISDSMTSSIALAVSGSIFAALIATSPRRPTSPDSPSPDRSRCSPRCWRHGYGSEPTVVP